MSDLLHLNFGVRIDQPGQIETDFHTTKDWRADSRKPLTTREYIMDAVFTVGLEGDRTELEQHRKALLNPAFPLFLGRRSCPPSGPIVLDIVDTNLSDALEQTDWQASRWFRRKQGPSVTLSIVRDAMLSEEADEIISDIPVSFDPTDRIYERRAAVIRSVQKDNVDSRRKRIEAAVEQDPLSVLEDL
ncbi:CRISPR system Cascade subunit CasD [Corynebacterium spheniscorum]|uniref:CRISPR system Cascade subunit CasD n=1 Tax=Corynebacterium spheniscorum TaxID=185761 RepID=A0A1I2QHX7_9CORY|nr:CRISPR system Cascade subunit CasD [Corynebacterium spheniscorum]